MAGPNAARDQAYVPPVSGNRLPHSAKQRATSPTKIEQPTYPITAAGPMRIAAAAGNPKIPDPTIVLMIASASVAVPIWRASEGVLRACALGTILRLSAWSACFFEMSCYQLGRDSS